jgi:hypothetical protein
MFVQLPRLIDGSTAVRLILVNPKVLLMNAAAGYRHGIVGRAQRMGSHRRQARGSSAGAAEAVMERQHSVLIAGFRAVVGLLAYTGISAL